MRKGWLTQKNGAGLFSAIANGITRQLPLFRRLKMNAFDPTLVRFVLNLIGAVSALVAAGLWFRSTTVSMPDRLDAIAVELQRVG